MKLVTSLFAVTLSAVSLSAAAMNTDLLGEPVTEATLHRLFEESLYVLYRLLFVLYAEARDVLPISASAA